MHSDQLTLLRSLGLLRWLAVGGQTTAVVAATVGLGLQLDAMPLYAGCAALAAFAGWASWHTRRLSTASTRTVLIHVGVDLIALTWMLYWSGGPANPFVSLYLLPIALVAFALPPRAVLLVALIAAAGYSLLMLDHVPIPHQHGDARFFDLHLVGMWVNFLLTAALVTALATRLAGLIGAQRRAIAEAREAALRNEGILAVATLAAATAHTLNTPLSTIAVVLADLAEDCADDSCLAPELSTLRRQVEVCRDAVRRLAVEAEPAPRTPIALDALIRRSLDRHQVLRPDGNVDVEGIEALASMQVLDDPRIEHLLLNLLNNALDASREAGRGGARLVLALDSQVLQLTVRDHGRGFDRAPADFTSNKPQGLGLGLTLSRVIAEHYGGRIATRGRAGGGEVEVALPLDRLVGA
jgi:two-component system sensor histidine kinase RegB